MESPFYIVRDFLRNTQLTAVEKMFVICLHLCAFFIILSIALSQFFSYVIIILAIIQFIKNPRREKTPFDIPLLLFILVRIAAVFFSIDRSVSIHALHTEIPYYFLFYAITQQRALIQERFVKSLIWMFVFGGIIGCCYGISSFLFGQQARAESITSGYYTFGSFLTAVLAILLVLGRSKMFNARRWIWYILVIVIAAGLILTMNRIHWGIMILLFIGIGIVQERKLLVTIILIFGIIVFFSPSVSNRFEQIIHFSDNLSGRDILWKGASTIWLNHPLLGYGPRTFYEIFPFHNEMQDVKVGGWHNDYIQVIIESGFLGLISLIWFIYTIYQQVFIQLRRMKGDKEKRRILLALVVGMSTIFISSLTGSGFLDFLIRIMFVFLLAMVSFLICNEENSRKNGI